MISSGLMATEYQRLLPDYELLVEQPEGGHAASARSAGLPGPASPSPLA